MLKHFRDSSPVGCAPHTFIVEGEDMSQYVRRYVSGGTFFFTVVAHRRRPLFASDLARSLLREVIVEVQQEKPFELVATVLLPEHWHCV